jgi:hypothetical protein
MRVVITPRSATCDAVMACLRSWSASGLLDPFCWWQAAKEGEPDFAVDRMEGGVPHREPLASALTGQPPERTALVAFYPATSEDGFDPRFSDRVSVHVTAAADVFAFRRHTTECTMIVAPAEIGQTVPPELFDARWETNVYAAPEDRASPQDVNILPGDETRFPMHAAHALATLADLWSTPGQAEQPVLGNLGSGAFGDYAAPVQVARCFSRVLDFGYLPDHLAAHAFQAGPSWPNPDRRHYDIVSTSSAYAPYLVKRYLDAHREVLGLSVVEPIQMPPPPEYGLLEALWLLLTDLIWRLRRAPFEKLDEVRTAIYNRAATVIQSKGGRRVRPLHGKTTGQVEELEADLERPLFVPDGAVAAAWTDLRRLALGLVDGAELPDWVEDGALRSGSTQRAVVVDPRRIVPDPEDVPPAVAAGQPRACDPLNLDDRFAKPESGEDQPEEVDQEHWVHPHLDTPLWMVGVGIARALRTAEVEGAAPPAAEERDAEAEAEELAAQRRLRTRLRRKQLRRRVGVSILLAIAAGYGAWESLTLTLRPLAFAAIAAIWTLWAANLARKALLRDRDEEHAELQAELDRVNRAILRAQRAGDAIRLERRYDEYLDWAEATGWVVHHPWVGAPLAGVEIRAPIDRETLPAAAAVAVAPAGEGLAALARRAQSQLFSPRWLSDVYAGVESAVMSEAEGGVGYAGGGDARWPDPAGDVSPDPGSPRRVLLAALRRGDHRQLDQSDMAANLLDFLDAEPIDALAKTTVPLDHRMRSGGLEALALPPAVGWFSAPDSIEQVADRAGGAVVSIEAKRGGVPIAGSGVVVGADGLVATARRLAADCEEIAVTTADGEVHDAELLRLSPLADLALLTAASIEVDGATLDGADSRIGQGDPVVTLCPAPSPDDEPALGWGLVTSTAQADGCRSFQVTLQSPDLASGAPVFDVQGRIVGIASTGASANGSGESDGGSVAAIAPVDALHALIATESTSPSVRGDGSADGDARAPGAGPARTPSEFLGAIAPGAGPVHLLPQHWVSPDADEEVARFLPEDATAHVDGNTPIERLSGRSRFHTPIRVLFHRTDLPKPSRSQRLASCVDDEHPEM